MADLGWRGVQRKMLNLASELARQGWDVDLVLVNAKGELLEVVPASVNVIDLDASRGLAALPGLISYLRRVRPCALISAEDNINVMALMARLVTGRPRHIAVSTHVSPGLWAAGSSVRHRTLRKLVSWFYPGATARIVLSQGMADEMSRQFGLPRDGLSVIHNPTVTRDLIEAATTSALPHPWLAAGQPPVVIGVGSLTPIKGFAVLVRAFAELRKTRPSRLIILGEGPQMEELKGLAETLGVGDDVALPGYVPSPAAWLAHAALFVLSSRSEGLPNVLSEALAVGCPAVATRCSAGPVEILDDGRYGKLVPVGDVGSMAEAMAATLDAPPDPSFLKARSMDFHVEKIVDQYIEVLGLRAAAEVRT